MLTSLFFSVLCNTDGLRLVQSSYAETNPEFDKVSALFIAKMGKYAKHCQVTNVDRIQNNDMWEDYHVRLIFWRDNLIFFAWSCCSKCHSTDWLFDFPNTFYAPMHHCHRSATNGSTKKHMASRTSESCTTGAPAWQWSWRSQRKVCGGGGGTSLSLFEDAPHLLNLDLFLCFDRFWLADS